jgi:hypothetical protein
MNETVEFNIKCKMRKEWVNHFISFLKEMETNGSVGHSELLGFYSDGDGSFNPKFEIKDVEDFEMQKPRKSTEMSIRYYDLG